jgi:septum formation protein
VDGTVLEKPVSELDARGMLAQLSGRAHEVLTGIAVVTADGEQGHVERTRVWFAPLTAGEIEWYVESGEPMDKAGAYAIQGLASRFVQRIEGSYANVVGLPVASVLPLLARAGVSF